MCEAKIHNKFGTTTQLKTYYRLRIGISQVKKPIKNGYADSM